jgi:hypothetical protein
MNKGFVKTIGRLKAVILPLVFNTTIHINILGVKNIKVCITAPGTITGTFVGTCIRLRSAEITIDTAALYRCMKARCDKLVSEVFETAALLLDVQSSNGDLEKPKEPNQATSPTDGGLCGSSQRRGLSTSGLIIPFSHYSRCLMTFFNQHNQSTSKPRPAMAAKTHVIYHELTIVTLL